MLLCVLMCSSCRGEKNDINASSTADRDPGLVDYSFNEDKFYFSSFDEIKEENVQRQNLSESVYLLDLVDNKDLNLTGYSVKTINVSFPKEGANRTGDQSVHIYWHEENCNKCNMGLCVSPNCSIQYRVNGIFSNLTDGYDEISENNYVKKVSMGKISYIYIVNDNCFLRLSIPENCENYDKVVANIAAYADYLRTTINNDNTVTE